MKFPEREQNGTRIKIILILWYFSSINFNILEPFAFSEKHAA
jgi:hypothetical protein